MNTLNFSTDSYVLYQILPNSKKFEFLYDTFHGDVKNISSSYFKTHFDEILSKKTVPALSIMTFLTKDGEKLNIFFERDTMHINCDSEAPINDAVKSLFNEGNILYHDKNAVRSVNSELFFMRYYRVYRRIGEATFPIYQS